MLSHTDIHVLEEVARSFKDAAHFYHDACDQAEDVSLKLLFERTALSREKFAASLVGRISVRGGGASLEDEGYSNALSQQEYQRILSHVRDKNWREVFPLLSKLEEKASMEARALARGDDSLILDPGLDRIYPMITKCREDMALMECAYQEV